MPLPPPETAREPLHTRSVRVHSYAREDGRWDIEAELIDTKAYDFTKHGGVHPAGAPIHHMHIRITIDDEFTIVAADAAYDAAPYGRSCTAIAPDYRGLIGMNLLRNFRQTVKHRFGRTAGCTHLTELCYVLPTVAVQSMANRRRQERERQAQAGESGKRPFQLDGCHALSVHGSVVREFYPEWYEAPMDAKCD